MGKKKTVNLNGEPLRDAPFTEGVQITYKHNTIAQSADSVEYALETGGKAVEADIGVTFIKPATPVFGFPVSITNEAGFVDIRPATGAYRSAFVKYDNGAFVCCDADDAEYVLMEKSENESNTYHTGITIYSNSDMYNVTFNGEAVAYDGRGGYSCKINNVPLENVATTTLIITITNKNAN